MAPDHGQGQSIGLGQRCAASPPLRQRNCGEPGLFLDNCHTCSRMVGLKCRREAREARSDHDDMRHDGEEWTPVPLLNAPPSSVHGLAVASYVGPRSARDVGNCVQPTPVRGVQAAGRRRHWGVDARRCRLWQRTVCTDGETRRGARDGWDGVSLSLRDRRFGEEGRTWRPSHTPHVAQLAKRHARGRCGDCPEGSAVWRSSTCAATLQPCTIAPLEHPRRTGCAPLARAAHLV